MSTSIGIIGAGVAGLSVGCYLQMNGYRTEIFERQELPGGLCAAWRRDGYVFDNCIQWLTGSAPGSSLYDAWQELGAVQGLSMVDHEEFTRVVAADGTTLIVYTDVDRLERHLRELSPEDGDRIKELTDLVRLHTRLDLPLGTPRELMSPLDRARTAVRMLPFAWPFARYGRVSLQSFAARFRSAFLREALTRLFDLPDFPLFGATMTLALMQKRTAGYPIGGSPAFIRNIERRYRDLGGRIHFHEPVAEILVERGPSGAWRATGVRLVNGSEHRADDVVSAADGHATLYTMLHGRFVDEQLRHLYDERRIFPPLVRVSLGVARDLSAEPHAQLQLLPEPLLLGVSTAGRRVPPLLLRPDDGRAGKVVGGRVPRRGLRVLAGAGRRSGQVCRREGTDRGHGGRPGRIALPGYEGPDRGGRRRDPAHLRAVHRQLAGVTGGNPRHHAEHDPADAQDAARPRPLLPGRALGPAGRRAAVGGVDRP